MRRILTAATLAAAIAFTTGCAAEGPPVSAKVQEYYDQNVASAKATLPPATPDPKVAFLGDSYSAGGGASSGMAWTVQMAKAKGWVYDVYAYGGTGYVTDSALGLNYMDSAPAVFAMEPNTVIVSGGRNDLEADPAAVGEAARSLFSTLSARGVRVIVTSPVWDARPAPAALMEIAAAVKDAADSEGATYLDIGQPFAGKPELITADQVHPNDAGHEVLADAVGNALTENKLP